jgi:hypothetical protein
VVVAIGAAVSACAPATTAAEAIGAAAVAGPIRPAVSVIASAEAIGTAVSASAPATTAAEAIGAAAVVGPIRPAVSATTAAIGAAEAIGAAVSVIASAEAIGTAVSATAVVSILAAAAATAPAPAAPGVGKVGIDRQERQVQTAEEGHQRDNYECQKQTSNERAHGSNLPLRFTLGYPAPSVPHPRNGKTRSREASAQAHETC